MTFFGDGATSEGDFHEAMNFAAVFQTRWSLSARTTSGPFPSALRQSRSETLAQKALAYGMPGIQVDGNDVLAVYSAAWNRGSGAFRRWSEPDRMRHLSHGHAHHGGRSHRYRSVVEVEAWRSGTRSRVSRSTLRTKGCFPRTRLRCGRCDQGGDQAAVNRRSGS